ncbi:MAG TPA: hypothetical protein VMQ59_10710 [Acidimicrobiales bacterium]|jgi:hypothetical protein|nr:hypothetical protein [Acidimicrobiales bacterium]
MQDQQHAQALVAEADPVGLFEPPGPCGRWAQRAADEDLPDTRSTGQTGPTSQGDDRGQVSGLVSPALVLLATVAILEGYSLLNVIPTGEWRWSAIALVVLTVPLALALTRPRRRTATQKLLALSSALLVALTVLTLLVDRSGVAHLLGAYDLVFAAAALGSVLVVERSTHRG